MMAERVKKLPPYPFAELEREIARKKHEGRDVTSFAIGDSDMKVPDFIVGEACRSMHDREGQMYSSNDGERFFREAVADWYKNRFGVSLDPEKEVIALIGSKEGIANIARAYVERGDRVLVPDPGYPAYSQGVALLCDGEPSAFLLSEARGFLPDVENTEVKSNTKLMFFSYPNNPTGAVATKKDMRTVADFCDDHRIIACHDNAYSEITFDGFKAPSFLQCSMNGVEFHSLSKTFNMTGFRIGFCVGNEDAVGALRKIKSQIDSGPSIFVQRAAARALASYNSQKRPECVMDAVREYERRRDLLYDGLLRDGIKCFLPKGTFYLWAKAGNGEEFAERLLKKDVVVVPGRGFGEAGKEYVRFALTQPLNRIEEALERMRS